MDAPSPVRRRRDCRDEYSPTRRLRALKVIEQCGNSLTLASHRLGISIPTLSKWRTEARLKASKSKDFQLWRA
jgi:transposase-like protein